MSWWIVPLIVLAAPALLLALAGWALRSAFRQVCAAVAPRQEESEWDAPVARNARRISGDNGVFARRVGLPIAAGGELERCSLN